MTNQEAIRLLDPQTTREALAEIEYYAGFSGKDACIKAIEDACIVAIAAMKKQIPKKPTYEADGYADGELVYDIRVCPNCGKHFEVDYYDFCPDCGQAIDWSEEE